jgi:hypothetical protein
MSSAARSVRPTRAGVLGKGTRNSCKVIEGEVSITHKRSRGELVTQADDSSSGDKVQEVEAPRGKS